MKTFKHLFWGAAIVLFGLYSCEDKISVNGNGIEATEGRIVSNFDKVKSSGAFDVHITEGTEREVLVRADENLIQYIETYVSGGTLHIDVEGVRSLRNTLPMEVFITTPTLEGIKLSGSGIITTGYFNTEEMDIVLSGSGRIKTDFEADETDILISGSGLVEVSGFARDGDFKISGSGKIEAFELDLLHCDTYTSGSGDMWISVERTLDSRISGSGNVFYYGTPQVESHISGSGNVISHN